MNGNLRGKTVSGVLWGFLEKFSLQAFGFIQGIILARLLAPSDYGLIAMTGIFTGLAYTLVDSGFSSALIQKKDKTEMDYSTTFITNVLLSFLICVVLWACSGLIAEFYHEAILKPIIETLAVLLLATSLVTIQDVRMTARLQFKQKSIVNVVTTISSGLLAIIMAFAGFGVWSLVYPTFLTIILKFILYWRYQHWFPQLQFSIKSCKTLFGFGSKILASSILATIFENIYPIVIGRKYSAKDLGYYSRGSSYSIMPSKIITSIIETVAYPVLSELQDDREAMLAAFRRMLRTSAFIIFPIMAWLFALAKPLVIVMISSKWLPCVIFLQLLCLANMWWHVHVLNLTLLKAMGRSDLFFVLEVVKKIVAVIILIITVPLGIIFMCYGSIFSALISVCINSFYTGKLMNFGIFKQLKDMTPSFLYSACMGICGYFASTLFTSNWVQVIVGSLACVVCYFGLAYMTGSADLNYITILIMDKYQGWHKA